MKLLLPAGLSLLFLIAGAAPAGAHVGAGPVHSFTDGFLHPFAGLDHLAAAFAVGLWAVLSGARRPLLLPLAFVTVMAAAAVAGAVGWRMPGIEPAIAATVIALGLLIVLAVRLPTAAGVALVALFAAVHGLAHGAEGGAAAPYLAGLVTATGALHAGGVALGHLALAADYLRLARLAGAAIAACGAFILAA